ncbi:MAG: hypothetical protein K2L74_01275 [Muribaculaceae bacterium]|nr:hypothetical protein [Muribaculaceae bacterium]
MFWLVRIIVPVSICCVLPCVVVWLVSRTKKNADDKRAEVLLEAIRANSNVDVNSLTEAMSRPKLSAEEQQSRRLQRGCLFSLSGVAMLIYGLFQLSMSNFLSDVTGMLLLGGGIALALGVSYLVVYRAVSKRQKNSDADKE